VKIIIDEGTSDPHDIRAAAHAAAAAGYPVALHAVSEAEVAIALDALRLAPRSARGPHRIEHGAVICNDWLPELRALSLTVVGQPTLVYERGDVYRQEYPPELHGWLHRAGSLLRAGVGYAAGSDAPVTEPDPLHGIAAARSRRTRSGATLGRDEVLSEEEALSGFTRGPATAVGAVGELGVIRPGAVADLVILDPDSLEVEPGQPSPPVRATIMNGQVVWQRG
jgi:predicted amidohydrolase YtcJ